MLLFGGGCRRHLLRRRNSIPLASSLQHNFVDQNGSSIISILLSTDDHNITTFFSTTTSSSHNNRDERSKELLTRSITATTAELHEEASTQNNKHDTSIKTTTTPQQQPTSSSTISNLAELSKARLSALVVSTTAFGFLSVGPTALAYTSLPTFAAASLGTALCASSAATFNQIIEVERDRKMKRTGNRPLVNGSVSKEMAIGLGCLTGSTGGIMLGLGTDPITTMLGVGNIGLYAGLYTYLKPKSEINTWVGAIVGAIPPVMGWTAAGGSILDPEAILLGSTLFLWQFPHFFALNWMYRTDYKRGGFSMVAVNDPNGDRTASLIKRYGLYLASLPILSTALEVTSPMFAVEGILLNGYALHVASKFDKERSNGNARKVFLTSLWYLPCVMMLFLLHSRRWHEEEAVTNDEKEAKHDSDRGDILDSVQALITRVQAKGKELCMHEALASKELEVWMGKGENKTSLDGTKCPISLSKNAAEKASMASSTERKPS
jgi:protoheme IX farnesyltransferase